MIAKNNFQILFVSPDHEELQMVQKMLNGYQANDFIVEYVPCHSDAVAILDCKDFDAVLVNQDMDKDNVEGIFTTLNAAYPQVPIVILSDVESQDDAFNALSLGAQDYLVKGSIQPGLLPRAILYAIERKRLQNMMSYLALHDALTGLPNRRLLMEQINRDFELSKRTKKKLAVFMLDIDDFKLVNDKFGHNIGDKTLIKAANRLQYLLRKCDIIARIGEDEFVIPIPNLSDPGDAEIIAGKIINAFKEPLVIDEHRILISFSIGIAIYPLVGADSQHLIRLADDAMYQAKKNGKGSFKIYGQKQSAFRQNKILNSNKG